MLKPYSIRNEFLLTLIVGGVCALLHYMFIQPPHIEESVHVFALIGLIVMFGNGWSSRGLRKKREQTPFNFCCRCMCMFDFGSWDFYEWGIQQY